MANMMKDLDEETEIAVRGDVLTATLSWKTTSSGSKGFGGRLKAASSIDLDQQAVLYGADGPKDLCYHSNLDPVGNGSIVLAKDDGAGGGGFAALKRVAKNQGAASQEVITLTLGDVPPWVKSVVLLASAFKHGVKITDAESVALTITDGNQTIYFKPTITDGGNTCLMARAIRDGSQWKIRKVNRMVTAHDKTAMLAVAATV